MRRMSSSPPARSAPRSRRVRAAVLALTLGGLAVFALVPRVAAAAPMHGVGAVLASGGMVEHAPTEVHVSPGLKKVLQGVLCQCGCNLDAYQCQQTMTCDVSTAMWDQAEQLVDREGKTPEQALQLFAADYGERVLAAPLKKGFNLTAWGLPLAAFLIGAAVLVLALRGWRPRAAGALDEEPPGVEARFLERIEAEVREED
jgi:cytochrome c-type biogenesis protein CcmH/NrfF